MMLTAQLEKQLMVTVDNKMGTLADITEIVAASGINLLAICAYAIDNKSFIMFVSENNKKAKKLLEVEGFNVREEEIVLVSVGNKPGMLRRLSEAIANLGIDLTLLYGSVEKTGKHSPIVLVSEDNRAVLTAVRMLQ